MTAAEPWFRSLIQAALFTGARWSELCLMKVCDADLQTGTILFPETKGGRPRHVHLTDDGLSFFVRQCRGKSLGDPVFVNQHGRSIGTSHQIRPMAETCRRAEVEPAGFHILRHTYGSTLAMAGVPLAVIAEALGHADERITRKHYAHLSLLRPGRGPFGARPAGRSSRRRPPAGLKAHATRTGRFGPDGPPRPTFSRSASSLPCARTHDAPLPLSRDDAVPRRRDEASPAWSAEAQGPAQAPR